MDDISNLKPMEMHRYLTQNSKVCPLCNKNKSFKTFWTKGSTEVKDVCNVCTKKKQEQEVFKQVLNSLTKSEIELIKSIEGQV
jgi:hypothetical protein